MTDLPGAELMKVFFEGAAPARRHRLIVLPVLERPACEHHIVVYVADLPGERIRLAAFSKRESRDPEVPPRDWAVLTTGEMPASRLDEFVSLLQDRLDSPSLELRELNLDEESGDREDGARSTARDGEGAAPGTNGQVAAAPPAPRGA